MSLMMQRKFCLLTNISSGTIEIFDPTKSVSAADKVSIDNEPN